MTYTLWNNEGLTQYPIYKEAIEAYIYSVAEFGATRLYRDGNCIRRYGRCPK